MGGTPPPRPAGRLRRCADRPGPGPRSAGRRVRAAPPPRATPGAAATERARPSAAPQSPSRSRRAPTRSPRSLPVAPPSFFLLPRARVGLLLLLLMPVPGHMVAVLDLLRGGELAGDLGVHLRPHPVESGPHRFPHCRHPGAVALQERPPPVARPGTQAQLCVQLVHHPVESP